MEKELIVESSIKIQAPAAKIWEALINPEITPKYMHGCEVQSDWKIGNPVLWKGAQDGITYVKGQLVHFDQERRLAYTTIDPNGDYEDIPENYLTVDCSIVEGDTFSLLKVSQGDYAKVKDGESRYLDTVSQGGWGSILVMIKDIAEQQ